MATVVVEELGVKKFKERDIVEGADVKSESRCAESIYRISATDI